MLVSSRTCCVPSVNSPVATICAGAAPTVTVVVEPTALASVPEPAPLITMGVVAASPVASCPPMLVKVAAVPLMR